MGNTSKSSGHSQELGHPRAGFNLLICMPSSALIKSVGCHCPSSRHSPWKSPGCAARMVGRKQDGSHTQEWPWARWFFPLHPKNKKVVAGLWPKPWGCGGKQALFVAMQLLACSWPGISAQDHPSDGSPKLCSTCSSLTEIKKQILLQPSQSKKSDGVKVTGLQAGATTVGNPG